MRVLHVAGTTLGGAGRGLMGLHKGLLDLGIDSAVLSLGARQSASTMATVRVPPVRYLMTKSAVRLDRLILGALNGRPKETFHTPWIPTPVTSLIRDVNPDILHLHWLGNTITAKQLGALSSDFPTVWTMRDLAPVTGGCHYSHGCNNFVGHCGTCPLLPRPSKRDATYWTHKAKLNALDVQNIEPIALSRWQASEIERSRLFRSRRVTVINPGVDTSVFTPAEREISRSELGLPSNQHLVGFVATHPFTDVRKGAHLLAEANRILREQGIDVWVVATATREEVTRALATRSDSWIPLGRTADDHKLSALYSACDVIAVPSTQEAFGKVAIEALACGVPVVAFAETGVADAVDHLFTGFLAKHGDVRDLSFGLGWALESENVASSPNAIRRVAVDRFGLMEQATSYADLYRSILHR